MWWDSHRLTQGCSRTQGYSPTLLEAQKGLSPPFSWKPGWVGYNIHSPTCGWPVCTGDVPLHGSVGRGDAGLRGSGVTSSCFAWTPEHGICFHRFFHVASRRGSSEAALLCVRSTTKTCARQVWFRLLRDLQTCIAMHLNSSWIADDEDGGKQRNDGNQRSMHIRLWNATLGESCHGHEGFIESLLLSVVLRNSIFSANEILSRKWWGGMIFFSFCSVKISSFCLTISQKPCFTFFFVFFSKFLGIVKEVLTG